MYNLQERSLHYSKLASGGRRWQAQVNPAHSVPRCHVTRALAIDKLKDEPHKAVKL